MAFANYLKNRDSFLEDTTKAIDATQTSQGGFSKDPDDWYPTTDKGGNGVAIIRFLPPLETEGKPFVEWFSHNFKNLPTDKYYIENSLKTFGNDHADPVAEYNKKLWNSTQDPEHPNRKQASAQKRQVNYRANVYVISDSANPENNGTIKKFKFGKTIFDKIRHAMKPAKVEGLSEADQEKAFNPFDLIEGANLRIKLGTELKGGKKQRTYEGTKFNDPKPLGDMDTMERIYNELQSDPVRWSLNKYVAKDQFKTYEALKARLDLVMGFDTATGEALSTAAPKSSSKPAEHERAAPKTNAAKAGSGQKGDEDDDGDSYFSNLMS